MLAETGFVGLASLVLAIAIVVLILAMRYRSLGYFAYAAALAVMTGYWVSGLFNFSYWSAWWQLSFCISMALCLAGLPLRPSRPANGSNPSEARTSAPDHRSTLP